MSPGIRLRMESRNRKIAKRFEILTSGNAHWGIRAQDGHTPTEELLYRALYAIVPGEASHKDLEASVRALSDLTGLSERTIQLNLKTLQLKLSIDVLRKFDTETNRPYLWRVYSPELIVARRRAAGMGWVQRSRGGGVRLVEGHDAGQAAASGTPGGFETGGVSNTPQ